MWMQFSIKSIRCCGFLLAIQVILPATVNADTGKCYVSRVGDYICDHPEQPQRLHREKPQRPQPPLRPKPDPGNYPVPVRPICEIAPEFCQPGPIKPLPPKICDLFPDLCKAVPPPSGLPPINSCGETVQATPATFLATLTRLKDSGGTIMLDPGTYPKFDLSNRSGCTLTIRCSQPGQCALAPGNQLTKVSNFILDGVVMKGGKFGIKINSGQNVLVTKSRFVEMSFAGITVYPYPDNENIQVTANSFENRKTGCTYNGNCSGTFPDGRPMPGMDYGVNAYDGKSIAIQGNTFGTLFGHAISLKHSVRYAYIADNTFNTCGSQCVELGQQPNTVDNPNWSVGEAVVTRNIFKDTIYKVVVVANIRKATITGNTFINAPKPIRVETYGACLGCIDGGIPPDRVVVQSPNTIR